jgi:branched-chain amino acid transport system ATP-binding protein
MRLMTALLRHSRRRLPSVEPSLGLAPIVIDLVMDALTALNQQGLTLLTVEQDATRALDVSDRVVVIRNGSTVMEASSAELAGSDDLRDAIFGHAPHVGN